MVSLHAMADSEQERVTKRQQELRKALNSRVTAGLGEDKSDHPCSHQWDRGFPAPGSLSLGSSSVRPQHPEAPPTSMRPKLSSPGSPAGEGGWAAQSMDFVTRKHKENLFFTFGSVTVKKQFQEPLVAKSKTNIPQGMGTHNTKTQPTGWCDFGGVSDVNSPGSTGGQGAGGSPAPKPRHGTSWDET